MAVADLDSDSSEELLLTTHAEENGVDRTPIIASPCATMVPGSGDEDSSPHPFINCIAGVADLDRDGKPDVFITVYSWLDDSGGLAALDGAKSPGLTRHRCRT